MLFSMLEFFEFEVQLFVENYFYHFQLCRCNNDDLSILDLENKPIVSHVVTTKASKSATCHTQKSN